MLNTVSQTDTSPATAEQGAYRQALGHSARVRRLRIVLPLVAVVIGGLFAVASLARNYLPEDMQIESASIENGKLVMRKPAIAGRNDKGISYSMKAERALQDITNPDLITLENIRALMPVNDSVVATVEAISGIYDRAGNKLDMTTPFTINLNNGLTAQFQSAKLDVTGGTMVSDKPVAIKTNDASIVAQNLQMTDKGQVVVFEGKVKVVIAAGALQKTEKK
ncbi:LPS export ABC transporter periplasmic protein LptC [Pararhizobium sp.]|uniref:LPS export ABC transporter periplasmic protein LptC n=1 Tax=Pararhizobium sp. TaxID=1977563 RepID=UPI00271D8892|nr:LPS export ABC transporter periplasmic protein LptC [Pararhizobium sp.]MDO9417717.1 LPS export ABC transporter periplasmic protein LptC [Pararhizobium sp.]